MGTVRRREIYLKCQRDVEGRGFGGAEKGGVVVEFRLKDEWRWPCIFPLSGLRQSDRPIPKAVARVVHRNVPVAAPATNKLQAATSLCTKSTKRQTNSIPPPFQFGTQKQFPLSSAASQ